MLSHGKFNKIIRMTSTNLQKIASPAIIAVFQFPRLKWKEDKNVPQASSNT